MSVNKINMYKKVNDILNNPKDYKQCIACKNAIHISHSDYGCPTCGSEYFEPEETKDFNHLKDVLPPNEEIEV